MFKRSHRGHGVRYCPYITDNGKKVAHDSFVRPPARSLILWYIIAYISGRRGSCHFSFLCARPRSARSLHSFRFFLSSSSFGYGSFFCTDNQLHLYAMFVYVFVSCRMSHRFVTHKASALYLCDSLHAIIYHNFYSACSCEHHDV